MEDFISISIQDNQFKYTYNDIYSSFLIQKNIMPIDLISKINSDKSKHKQTHISLLHNITSEKINLYNDIGYKTVRLNSNNTISMKTDLYNALLKTYSQIDCDTIFSPYHILINNIQEDHLHSQLNILLLDNKLYILITDETYKVTYNKIISLTTIKEIEQSKFFIDSIGEQQLFQEIHQLEIEQYINQSLEEYSLLNNSINIENVNLFYSLKTVSTQAEHHKINIAHSLKKLALNELVQGSKSYKDIKNKKSTNILLTLFIVVVFLLIGYSFIQDNPSSAPSNIKEKSKIIIKKDITFETQNHIEINNNIISTIKQILNTITYDAIINEAHLNHDSSTIKMTNLYSDTFIKNIEPNLKTVYENSKLLSQVQAGDIYNSTIENSELIDNKHRIKEKLTNYTKQAKTKKEIETLILSLLPQESKIELINKDNNIYNFKILLQAQNPNHFYNLIEKLSLQNHHLSVAYPINIVNHQKYLDVTLNLKYQQ